MLKKYWSILERQVEISVMILVSIMGENTGYSEKIQGI